MCGSPEDGESSVVLEAGVVALVSPLKDGHILTYGGMRVESAWLVLGLL